MPEWTRWGFAAALVAVCAFCLARLAVLRGPGRSAGLPHWHEDLTQVLMGVGMISMFLSFSGLVPRPVWLVLFLGMAAGFAAPMLLRGRGVAGPPAHGMDRWQAVHHVMAGLAMAYMLAAIGLPDGAAAADGMTGMAGSIALTPLAASFGMYFLVTTAWSGYRLVTGPVLAGAGGTTGPAVLRAPRLVEGCRTVMGVGMAFMLLAMA
jgi:Domain of unknown function (DUF5134)